MSQVLRDFVNVISFSPKPGSAGLWPAWGGRDVRAPRLKIGGENFETLRDFQLLNCPKTLTELVEVSPTIPCDKFREHTLGSLIFWNSLNPTFHLLFLVLSGMATGASWLCYFRALKLGNASQVAPIDKLSVVMVAIFAAIFLGERLSGLSWAGVALIGIGAVFVAVG